MATPARLMAILFSVLLSVLATTGDRAASSPDSELTLEPEFRRLREQLRAAPDYKPQDARANFRLAEELSHRGDVHGAIAAYRETITLDPAWADPYRGLGQVLLDHHDYAPAAEALQAGIRLGRDDAQSFYWLARAFMGQGEVAAAAVALERATVLNSQDAEAFADLGLVRMAEGDLTGAEKALSRSIAVKPDYADAHRLRELLIKHRASPEQAKRVAHSLLAELFARP
jgi:cytochrome c-type biogenesis protein CcmH/NrfG